VQRNCFSIPYQRRVLLIQDGGGYNASDVNAYGKRATINKTYVRRNSENMSTCE